MPRFTGGIITELAEDLLPRAVPGGFRRNLPPRVQDSGRIFRDIVGLENIFETKGSGAGPEMLRSEMGVMYGFDLTRSLQPQLMEPDVFAVAANTAAASTTITGSFSFPRLHRILNLTLVLTANPANFAGFELRCQPFGDPSSNVIAQWLATGVVTAITGLQDVVEPRIRITSPWIMRPEVDYTWVARSNAGGGFSSVLRGTVLEVPDGLTVPL